ncbi:MAG: hypothetical protein J6P03_08540 [Opitutales bacterium]|nr:hypothetical protein [Opitutales bacterium]
MTDKEEEAMADKNTAYYKPCGAAGCPAQGRAPAPDIDPVRHRGYADIEQWRGALAEYAQEAQLNLGKDWRDTTAALWDNGRRCTCQVGDVPCPCPQGVALAKGGGDCHCGLFVGHNVD